MSFEQLDAWLLRQHQRFADWWTDVTNTSHYLVCRILAMTLIGIGGILFQISGITIVFVLMSTIAITILVVIYLIELLVRINQKIAAQRLAEFHPFGQTRIISLITSAFFELYFVFAMISHPNYLNIAASVIMLIITVIFYLSSCTPRPLRPQESKEKVHEGVH